MSYPRGLITKGTELNFKEGDLFKVGRRGKGEESTEVIDYSEYGYELKEGQTDHIILTEAGKITLLCLLDIIQPVKEKPKKDEIKSTDPSMHNGK